MLLAAPALVETYAVLTRLPAPYRLAPADALALLETGFMRTGRIVALTGRSYRDLLARAPDDGIVGGRTCDAVIAACAARGKASALLTFNAGHFEAFATESLEIVVP